MYVDSSCSIVRRTLHTNIRSQSKMTSIVQFDAYSMLSFLDWASILERMQVAALECLHGRCSEIVANIPRSGSARSVVYL